MRKRMFHAVHIGGLLPIAVPLILLALGSVAGSARTRLEVGQPRNSELPKLAARKPGPGRLAGG